MNRYCCSSVLLLIFLNFSYCSENRYSLQNYGLLSSNESNEFQNQSVLNENYYDILVNDKKDCYLNLYYDQDHDNYGSGYYGCTTFLKYITTFSNDYSTNNDDCNDNDSTIYLGAPELEDNKDNDCDNLVDEGIRIVPKSIIAGSQTFDFSDGVYIDNNNCSGFTVKINIYAYDYERNYILNNANNESIEIQDADRYITLLTSKMNTSQYYLTEDSTNGMVVLTIKPSNFCQYITTYLSSYIRISFSLLPQEGKYEDSFIIRNSYLSTDGSMPKGVPFSTNIGTSVRLLLLPIFFDDLSSAATDTTIDAFKDNGIRTGLSNDQASSSTDYSDVSLKIYPNSSSKRYNIEFSASGIWKSNDCLESLYMYKPKLKLDLGLKVPSIDENLASNTMGNFDEHTVDYYKIINDDPCDPEVELKTSEFSNIKSDPNKYYKAHEYQFAIDLYSMFYTLNNKQPKTEDDVEDMYNELVVVGDWWVNTFADFAPERIGAALSLGIYNNDLLTNRLSKNDLGYNGKNTGALLQKDFRDWYKSAWPDELADKHTLDPQRFYGTYRSSSGGVYNANGDILGAIQYYINSLLTFKLPYIAWLTDIGALTWNIALNSTSVYNNGSYFDFSTFVTGNIDGNTQKFFPFFQSTLTIPYDENNFDLDINSVLSVTTDLAQQFISSSVIEGFWNVEHIIEFPSEPIVTSVYGNEINLKAKGFLFGGEYVWNGTKLNQFYKIDASAKVIVNQTTSDTAKSVIENYLGEDVDNDFIVAADATAEITTTDITYVEPLTPEINFLDYNSLKAIGVEALYYVLHDLACNHYRDETEDESSLDGWDFMIPIDGGNWVENNPGKTLNKENYCSNTMTGYVTRYLMYGRFKDAPAAQVATPLVIRKTEITHQMDFGFDLQMFTSEDILGEDSDPGTGYGQCSPTATSEKCYEPDPE